MTPRRYRFAPTPSRELHVGNALAALFDWALARAHRATFVLRIEDIDTQRCRAAYERSFYRDLAWLGLDWDEGPDVGGPHAPYRQSERLERYDTLMRALYDAGLAYVCACSRADLRAAQSAPHVAHPHGAPPAPAEPPYPGTCRGRARVLLPDRGGYRLDLAALAPHVAPVVTWHDTRLGPQRDDVAASPGDVLLGRPGQPTYQLAVVADDLAMHISDVVRGVDLLGSTARQILLRRALTLAAPHLTHPATDSATDPVNDLATAPAAVRHLHHPLLLDHAGHKLSKRDAATPLASLSSGSPSRLVAALGVAVGLFPASVHTATPADWIDAVAAAPSLATLHDAPWPPPA